MSSPIGRQLKLVRLALAASIRRRNEKARESLASRQDLNAVIVPLQPSEASQIFHPLTRTFEATLLVEGPLLAGRRLTGFSGRWWPRV